MRWQFLTALIVASYFAFLAQVSGQHNHAQGHSDYMQWQSPKTSNCCSNQDCGSLSGLDVRETAQGTQVQIDGEWCPVLSIHRIIRGKSPDWSVAHACVSKNPELKTCDKLLCFVGRGGL